MSREPLRLSRRQVLAGVSGMGAFGAAGGAASDAYLSDRESVSSTQGTGQVGLTVTCGTCVTGNGVTKFTFDDLDPDSEVEEEERFELSIDGNPIRVWLRTTCPPAVDPLGETLEVRLWVETNCGDPGGRRDLHPNGGWTTLAALREELASGIRVDDPADPCFSADDDPCLHFEYRLSNDAAWAASAESELTFEFVAEQCRHVPESNATQEAFPTPNCPDLNCSTCDKLGTIKLQDDRLVPGKTYALDGDDEHEIEVLQVTNAVDTVDNQETRETVCVDFRLLKDGEESAAPPICEVSMNSGSVSHEIDPPLTRTRGRICTPSDGDGGDGSRPGITSITVSTCADGGGKSGGDDS